MIYADNAATTKLDKDALEAMLPWLTEEYSNASQPYSFSRPAKKALEESRATIAACINAEPGEIFFTSGGTESDNWAVKGTAYASRNRKHIITTPIEHHAILNTCKALTCQGFSVDYVTVDNKGLIDQDDLNQKLSDDPTLLVSIMMANNEIGTIQSFDSRMGSMIHSTGALFHTDAVQATGHVPIDVKEIGVDLLSASGHKFNGPKGIGFLYIKKGTPITSINDGGAQEFGMRAGTENIASIVGMATALSKNCKNMIEEGERLFALEERLVAGLKQAGIDFVRNGSFYGKHLPGNISLSFKNSDGEMILHRLDLMGICISTGSACDSKNTQVSHVIKAIDVPKDYQEGTIRISLGKENTEQDISVLIKSLVKVLR